MKKSGRIIALLLATVLVVASFSACSKKSNDNASQLSSLTSIELAELMGNGINLGNTMEAYGHVSLGVAKEPSQYETSWGMPVTTKEMVEGMKNAGFDTIRIPVAWTNAMDYESGDYTIADSYLARVKEIVDYAINADMYVIVNDHWDGGWWGMFGDEDTSVREQGMELYKSMWTQVSTYFKGYDEHLIFESANEEVGFRLNDDWKAKGSAQTGVLTEEECYDTTNKINQAFVDVVRTTGGNNENRFLLIAGFGTDIEKTCNDAFKMPTDIAKDKLLISIHYYEPSSYCINTSIATWGTKEDYEKQNSLLKKMTKFTDAGYGVVIGEYGVLMDGKKIKENTMDYLENFMANCDLYGYVPVLWDCSNFYDRSNCAMINDEIASFYKNRNYENQKIMTADEINAESNKVIANNIDTAVEAAGVDSNTAMAWLMFTSGDWNTSYSVGDEYAPDNITSGGVATDVEITGAGTYTVGVDFSGTDSGSANGIMFSAVGITNAEVLYPDCLIEIKDIKINGESISFDSNYFTTSDALDTTRCNIYNEWVTSVPKEARQADGDTADAKAVIVDKESIKDVVTMEVTFEFVTK